MSTIVFAITMFAAIVLQATLMHDQQLVAVVPDLTLVLVLVWSALRGWGPGLVTAFAAGLILDVVGLDSLGTNALALLVAVILGGLAGRRFFQTSMILPLVLTLVATFLHAIILLLVRSGEGGAVPFDSVFRMVVLQAVLNLIVVPPIYFFASLANRDQQLRYA